MKKAKIVLIITSISAFIAVTFLLISVHYNRASERKIMTRDNYCLSTQLEMIEYVNTHRDEITNLSELLLSNPEYVEDNKKMNELFSENNLDYFLLTELSFTWDTNFPCVSVHDNAVYWQYVLKSSYHGEDYRFTFVYCTDEASTVEENIYFSNVTNKVLVSEEGTYLGDGLYILPYIYSQLRGNV